MLLEHSRDCLAGCLSSDLSRMQSVNLGLDLCVRVTDEGIFNDTGPEFADSLRDVVCNRHRGNSSPDSPQLGRSSDTVSLELASATPHASHRNWSQALGHRSARFDRPASRGRWPTLTADPASPTTLQARRDTTADRCLRGHPE